MSAEHPAKQHALHPRSSQPPLPVSLGQFSSSDVGVQTSLPNPPKGGDAHLRELLAGWPRGVVCVPQRSLLLAAGGGQCTKPAARSLVDSGPNWWQTGLLDRGAN